MAVRKCNLHTFLRGEPNTGEAYAPRGPVSRILSYTAVGGARWPSIWTHHRWAPQAVYLSIDRASSPRTILTLLQVGFT